MGQAFCRNVCNCSLHLCPPSAPEIQQLYRQEAGISCSGWELLIQSSLQETQVIDNISRFELAVAAAEKVLLLISNRVGIISLFYMARDLGKLSPSSCTPR